MKKILSVILAAAALLTLAACKSKPVENKETQPYSPEDFQAEVSRLEAERQSEIEAENAKLQKKQDEINKEIEKYISSEIGKSKKNKELVIEVVTSAGKKFEKYVYNRKGELDHKIVYYFYEKMDRYRSRIDVAENTHDSKVIEKDKKTLMVVVKHSDMDSISYEELYKMYTDPETIDPDYRVVE